MIQRIFVRPPLLAFIIACLLLAGCDSKPTSIGGVGSLALQGNYLLACGGQYVYRIDLRDNSFESFSLPCGLVYVIKNGWVVVPTYSGVAINDGQVWRNIDTPQKRSVQFVSETNDGLLWVSGTSLSTYNIRTGAISVIVPSIDVSPATPSPVPGEWAVSLPSPGEIGPVLEAIDSSIWYNQQFDGIVRWTRKTGEKQIWGRDDGFQGYDPLPRKFLQTHDGSIWVGTLTGAYRLNGNTWQAWKFPGEGSKYEQAMDDFRVIDMLEDHDGNVWVVFNRAGVAMWDGSIWQAISNFKFPVGPQILFEDSFGAVWIGSLQHGVTKIQQGVSKEYSGIFIRSFVETPDHRLFGGSFNNLMLYDRKADQWEPFITK